MSFHATWLPFTGEQISTCTINFFRILYWT